MTPSVQEDQLRTQKGCNNPSLFRRLHICIEAMPTLPVSGSLLNSSGPTSL